MSKKAKITAAAIAVVAAAVIACTALFLAKLNRDANIDKITAINHQQNDLMCALVDKNVNSLIEFSRNDIVKELLLDEKNEKLLKQAQKYTEDFSQNIPEIEGLWIGSLETKVLTHTNTQYIKMLTRVDEGLRKSFLDVIVDSGDEVYNMGLTFSVATGRTYAKAYKGVYDDGGRFIGFTSISVETEGLYNSMKSLGGSGVAAIDTDNGIYLFSDDGKDTGEKIYDRQIVELCDELGSSDKDGTYRSDKKLMVYSYFADRKILVINEAN